MKKFNLALLCLVFTIYQCYSQSACSKTIFNCNQNFSTYTFDAAEIASIKNISYAKQNGVNIAPDASYSVDCPQPKSCYRDGSSLVFDVYYPSTHNYNNCALPAMFLFHGGGFSDCSNKDETETNVYAGEFVRRGFVVFTVEYRRGKDLLSSKTSPAYMLAAYRGMQDLRGAIRSAIKMQQDGMFTNFRFDKTNIFVGGAGTVPLHTAFYQTQRIMDSILPGVAKVLGPINAEFYYAPASTDYHVRAVFNESGALTFPANVPLKKFISDLSYPLPALITFTGGNDPIAIPQTEDLYFDDSFNAANVCLLDSTASFKPNNYNGNQPDLLSAGGITLYNLLSAIGLPNELYLDCKMGHYLSSNKSGFGTMILSTKLLQQYIAGRVVTFFQAVVNGYANQLNDNKFYDCVNLRYGCGKLDNNSMCSNSDECNSKSVLADDVSKYPTLFTYIKTSSSLNITLLKDGKASVFLYDANGNLLVRQNTFNKNISLLTGSLKQGVYMVKVVQNNNMQNETILF